MPRTMLDNGTRPKNWNTMLSPLPLTPPDKTHIATLPPFAGLTLDHITVVRCRDSAEAALQEMRQHQALGFDTESRPTFHKGQNSEGPHVLQFSSLDRAWLFQSHQHDTLAAAFEVLQSTQVAKVGFGLKSDLGHLGKRFGIIPQQLIDLDNTFRRQGYRQQIGAKTAIAMLFGQKLAKSKHISTSNWASKELAERQLLYAANDAYAAIRVHQALLDAGLVHAPV
ncbi:3'-5' exonuclease domain-containing protein 2 [Rhodobacteraceae bacterium CH30]|nr:3'-5' exonuclease domain-containing protein 2 [Rhodobacteraceae bacterium CH30]